MLRHLTRGNDLFMENGHGFQSRNLRRYQSFRFFGELVRRSERIRLI